MKSENQQKRKQQIEAAAYDLLRQKGYKATSMLAIAKHASASNETLYKWYGNKHTLFASLVQSNIQTVRESLENAITQQHHSLETLKNIGPPLLKIITGERAVTLNRAAAADVYDSHTLGHAIALKSRETIAPLITQVIVLAKENGLINFDKAEAVTDMYLRILIGDLQIRRVIGACDELPEQVLQERSKDAISVLLALYGTTAK